MRKKLFHMFLGVSALLLLWGTAVGLGLIDAFFLPSPAEVLSELFSMLSSGSIVPDLLATLSRLAISFAIAAAAGIPFGLALGSSNRLYESVEFLIDFFRSLPVTAIFPLFLLILGIGEESKIGVAAFGALLIILFNTAHGVKHSNRHRRTAAKLMGATKTQVFKAISFWESLPQTFAGLRTAVSITLIIVIVTEMFIGTRVGLGNKIMEFQYVYNISGMYATIILTGIVGYGINSLFVFAEKRIVHWSGH